MRHYDRGYAEMKRIIDSGELGAPLMIHACHRNVSQPDGFQTEMGVSNVAIHELDICRWLLGDEYKSGQVLKVRQSACSTKGYDNPQIVLLETQSGARIDVEVQVADAYGYDIQCQVVCEKGTVNLPDPYAVVKRSNATRSFPILTDWKDRFIEAYDIELTHWVKTLEEKGEPDGPSAWDGYAACVAADTLNRSRGTNQFLPIEMMDKPALIQIISSISERNAAASFFYIGLYGQFFRLICSADKQGKQHKAGNLREKNRNRSWQHAQQNVDKGKIKAPANTLGRKVVAALCTDIVQSGVQPELRDIGCDHTGKCDQAEQQIKRAGCIRRRVARNECQGQQADNGCRHAEHSGCERTLQALGHAAEPVKRIKLHEGAEYTENAGNGERCTVCAVQSDGAAELSKHQ